TFANNATVITFFDREGKAAGTAGERALYGDVVLSPDRTLAAVVKRDLAAENWDLWILDVATGKTIRMSTSAKDEWVSGPVWSPDSSQVAYVAVHNGSEVVYRRAANGQGLEELLYTNPGFGLDLSDW